ncbi:transporter substrate-binding domain-containing protein [Vagococcus hydrophili]|uniref:Transporter substrate-binding domain-containing protein n=1 Tax=Vagococcus hydrophili TaxID=2714947 RepID=A0A6G8AUZ1_9ENTE|nr:transporter substrate-binding domain-containing protein [Vagococcus hydrophili]QIL48807.1 transporter substrate-binding domain-containing protein [Vagococcus hydrophili]
MKRQLNKLAFLFLFGGLFFILTGCKSENVANTDTLEKVQSNEKIVWGVKYDTKLFGMMNIEERKVEGFDIDIASAVTRRVLGEDGKAEFVEVTSKTRIPLLKNGNIDAIIATMTISEERKKQVDFSDVYFDAGQSLLVKKGSDIKSVTDLNKGKTVLAVKGSTSAENIRKHAPEAKVLELENYAEAFTALQSGQGDAMTTDNSILLGMSAENPDYVLAGEKFTDEPYGIALNKEQEMFKKAVNKALKEMKQDGEYAEIYQKWFKEEAK